MTGVAVRMGVFPMLVNRLCRPNDVRIGRGYDVPVFARVGDAVKHPLHGVQARAVFIV